MGWVSISELLLDLTDLGHKKDTCISEQSKMSRLGCGSKLWSRSTLATNNYVCMHACKNLKNGLGMYGNHHSICYRNLHPVCNLLGWNGALVHLSGDILAFQCFRTYGWVL